MIGLALTFACTEGKIEVPPETGAPAETGPGPTESEPTEETETETETETDPPPPPPAVAVAHAPAFDPVAGAPLEVTITVDTDAALEISIVGVDGTAVVSSSAVTDSFGVTWSGTHPAGGWAPAGAYTVRVSATADGQTTEVEQVVHLVRVGLVSVDAGDDGGKTGTRVPLFWHEVDALQDVGSPIAALPSMEDELGAGIPLPPVMDPLGAPTAGLTEPVAYVWDSRPILTFVPGDSVVFAGTGLEAVAVGVRVDGWTVLSGVPLLPGQPVLVQRDAPLSETLGVTDLNLPIVFTVADGAGGTHDVATTEVPLRFLQMLDLPSYDSDGEPYVPWVAAVEPALRGIDGTAPDHFAALDALVGWIFEDLGLSYDTRYGASAYTTYAGGDWRRANFYMSSFLDRDYGDVVNCTDCAGILGNYANMIGAYLNYVIILPSFDLNYILAIGGAEFTSCPFGPRGCGFSYHAVTTVDAGDTIWDATLAIDGDGDPENLPATTRLVQQIPGEDYLDAIVRDGNPSFQYESQGTLQ